MLSARGVDDSALSRARRQAASIYHCPGDVAWKDWIEGEGRQYAVTDSMDDFIAATLNEDRAVAAERKAKREAKKAAKATQASR